MNTEIVHGEQPEQKEENPKIKLNACKNTLKHVYETIAVKLVKEAQHVQLYNELSKLIDTYIEDEKTVDPAEVKAVEILVAKFIERFNSTVSE